MKAKAIVLIAAITIIAVASIYADSVKEELQKRIITGAGGYACGEEGLCNSCIIRGQECSCGRRVCNCGNETVNASECRLL